MGQSTPIVQASPSVRHYLVGQDGEGHWVVRDEAGLAGGLFVDKKAAIRFAGFETEHRPNAVLFVPEHVRLPLSGPVPRL